jgi:hypothetical protein
MDASRLKLSSIEELSKLIASTAIMMTDAIMVDHPITGMDRGLDGGIVVCIEFSSDNEGSFTE